MRVYQLPTSILINQDTYERWLYRKAKSIKKRDGKNSKELGVYREAIHEAVCISNGKDFYTGDQLDWTLLSKFNNDDAHKDGVNYMKKFFLLPTVDHYEGRGKVNFVICSQLVNDAKSHMSHDEFLKLCHKVIKHHAK